MSTTSPGLSTILEQSHELESGNEQAPGSTLSPSAQSPQQGRSFGRSRSSSSSIDASKAIFALKFSPNGRYLATAGAEGVIKIWRLIAPGILDSDSTLDRDTFGRRGSGTSASKLRSSVQLKEPPRVAAIFEPEPVQILKGHSGEILDLTWSANDFLLSASMDRTVRLWHYSRSEALGIFQHLDYVTSVAFHPRDPRLFVSGSLDCRLRLWSIQERTVQAWNELPPGNFITAAAFTRTGKTVVAGTSSGIALLFEAQSLKYHTQILVRSSNRSSGKKITGIEPVVGHQDDERILVSSNDSRIRMYSLRDKNVLYKYKGHSNVSSQIGASLSSDGDYVLGGSEDCRVYIWNVDGKNQKRGFFSSFRKDHISAHESFKGTLVNIYACSLHILCIGNSVLGIWRLVMAISVTLAH
jgi:WD40 repeat protein